MFGYDPLAQQRQIEAAKQGQQQAAAAAAARDARDKSLFGLPGFADVVGRIQGQSPWAQQQSALATYLQRQATGQGPSLAEQQLRAGLQAAGNRAVAAQQSMAAGVRGSGAGLAQRMAANNAARIMTQVGGEANVAGAQARLAEQQAAQSALAALLAGARGQDQGQLGLELQARQAQQGGMQGLAQLLEARRQFDESRPGMFESLLGGLAPLGGLVLGGALGGPAGAAAGAAAAGGAIGGGATVPSWMNLGSTMGTGRGV